MVTSATRRHVGAAATTVGHHPRIAVAAALLIAAGTGFAGGRIGLSSAQTDLAAQRWTDATHALHQNGDEMTRLAGDIRLMRTQLDALRTQRGDTGKLAGERLEKNASDQSARLAKLADQVERMEKTQRDPSRIASIVERLDRIERQTQTVAEKVTAPVPPPKPVVAPVAVATPAAPEVTQTGSIAPAKPEAKATEAKPVDTKAADAKTPDHKVAALAKEPSRDVAKTEPDPRKTQLDSYVLRDVGEGIALVESQNGRLIEVKPGQLLGTGAKVEAIERRGRHWVVVTSKGFIGERW